MEISVTRVAKAGTRPKDEDLGFGTVFTDHMFVMEYAADKGWHDPRIEPFAPFSLSPASMVFHYGQAIFEGLKAYKTPDKKFSCSGPGIILNASTGRPGACVSRKWMWRLS
jgi:branched-chain amino acid aminotransferase